MQKWLLNKNINPKSMRKIKETGIVYKKLAEKCLDKNKEVKQFSLFDDELYDNLSDELNIC